MRARPAPGPHRAGGAVLRAEDPLAKILQPDDYWSFRGANDLIYLVYNEGAFSRYLGDGLRLLLASKTLDVYSPPKNAFLFQIEIDWSQLISIEIQAKKTLDQLAKLVGKPREQAKVKLHVKCYFEASYAIKYFKADEDKIASNFNEVASYYNPDKAGSAARVFSEDYPGINTLVVDDIKKFIDSAGPLSLALNKNTYILSSGYVSLISSANKKRTEL